MIAVTLYSRPGCHLCDDMKAVIDRVSRSFPMTISVVDISTDPQLETLHGQEIPVLMVDGKKAAKYRVSERDLVRLLNARTDTKSGGAGRAGGVGKSVG
jgi:glutaredoxin